MSFDDEQPKNWGAIADFIANPKFQSVKNRFMTVNEKKRIEDLITNHKNAKFIMQNENIFNEFLR